MSSWWCDLGVTTLRSLVNEVHAPEFHEFEYEYGTIDNREEITDWAEKLKRLSEIQLAEKLNEPSDPELATKFDEWSGLQFLALQVGWPLELGGWLAKNENHPHVPSWLADQITLMRHSKKHTVLDAHTPSEWIEWASTKGLFVREELQVSGLSQVTPCQLQLDKLNTKSRKTFLRLVYAMACGGYGWDKTNISKIAKDIGDDIEAHWRGGNQDPVAPQNRKLREILTEALEEVLGEASELHHDERD